MRKIIIISIVMLFIANGLSAQQMDTARVSHVMGLSFRYTFKEDVRRSLREKYKADTSGFSEKNGVKFVVINELLDLDFRDGKGNRVSRTSVNGDVMNSRVIITGDTMELINYMMDIILHQHSESEKHYPVK